MKYLAAAIITICKVLCEMNQSRALNVKLCDCTRHIVHPSSDAHRAPVSNQDLCLHSFQPSIVTTVNSNAPKHTSMFTSGQTCAAKQSTHELRQRIYSSLVSATHCADHQFNAHSDSEVMILWNATLGPEKHHAVAQQKHGMFVSITHIMTKHD